MYGIIILCCFGLFLWATKAMTGEVKPTEVGIFLKRIELYEVYIKREAQTQTIDPVLIRAMIWQESNGHKDPPHLGIEEGLMGLSLPAAEDMGYKGTREGLIDPETNIKYGVAYLRHQIDRYNGNVTKGLVAYNAGYYTGNLIYAEQVWKKHALIKNALLIAI